MAGSSRGSIWPSLGLSGREPPVPAIPVAAASAPPLHDALDLNLDLAHSLPPPSDAHAAMPTAAIPTATMPHTAATPVPDDFPRQMLLLFMELLQGGELPELAVGGAWFGIGDIFQRGGVSLLRVALEADICGLATAHLRAIGPAADWIVSLSPPRPRGMLLEWYPC